MCRRLLGISQARRHHDCHRLRLAMDKFRQFQVGFTRSGTLYIENGGTVTAVTSSIGSGAGYGTATVTGSGSQWLSSGSLNIVSNGNTGSNGTGTLNVQGSGSISAPLRSPPRQGPLARLNIGAPVGSPAGAPGTIVTNTVAFGAGALGIQSHQFQLCIQSRDYWHRHHRSCGGQYDLHRRYECIHRHL